MAGFSRFLAVLRVFDETASAWSVPDLADTLGVPASTAYRTVRDLVDAGFLEAAHDGAYRLGPAFIEYDRLLRMTDPLVHAGAGALRDVVMQAHTPCVALLSRLYNDQVMCVADEAARETSFRSSYERGKPMPLTQGATSKAILAQLPARQLNRLIGAPKTAPGYEPLRRELAEIRRRGYCATASEIDTGLAGIAAPVIVREAGVYASLSLVADDSSLDDGQRRRLVLLVVSAASLISEELRHRHNATSIHTPVLMTKRSVQ
jgi:DNA-binding IclR family transcriptional regulator